MQPRRRSADHRQSRRDWGRCARATTGINHERMILLHHHGAASTHHRALSTTPTCVMCVVLLLVFINHYHFFFVIFWVVDLVFLCVICVVWGGVFSVVCEWEWSRGAAHSARHLINTMKWDVAPDYCYRVHSSPSCYLSRAWNNDSVCWALLAPIHSLYYNYLSFI